MTDFVVSAAYTLSDLEADVDHILQDLVDVCDPWTESLSETDVGSIRNINNSNSDEILFAQLRSHVHTLRYVDFAVASLSAEISLLNTSTTTSRSGDALKIEEKSFTKYPLRLENFLETLPMTLVISDILRVKNESNFVPEISDSARDSSIKQLQRDIDRDKLVVNGIRLVGADGGLNHILATMGDIIDRLLFQCKLPVMTQDNRDNLCIQILKKVARTNSGGTTFQCLQTLLDVADTLIIPVSTLAKPLRIHISINHFGDLDNECKTANMIGFGNDRWGLRCHIEGATVFRIHNSDSATGDMEGGTTIHASYMDDICVEVDPRRGYDQPLVLFDKSVCGRGSARLIVSKIIS